MKSTIKHSVHKAGTVAFNVRRAASLSLEDFQAEHADKYPDLSDADRNQALADVHALAKQEVTNEQPPQTVETTSSTTLPALTTTSTSSTTSNNGKSNSGGNGKTVRQDQTGTGSGGDSK